MQEIIKADLPLISKEISIIEAKKLFKDNEYKLDWISQIEQSEGKVSIYCTGEPGKVGSDFDLCKGPHIQSTGKIGAFKLLSVAGAYWHGDEKNKMLTRIYGTCFPTKQELDKYLWQIEEAKKRDHRFIGKKLELFMLDDEVGQGLPIWLPKGAFVRHKVMEFAFNTYLESGYVPVVGPHIASESLWSHSGHLDFYKESMYNAFGIDNDQYRLKPMNCPIHVKIYNRRPRSYRELPIRYTEMGTVYRYEKSGVLHGLTRVRGFTQDDAHIICSGDQLNEELVKAIRLTLYILQTFGFRDFEMNLSVRDPKTKEKYAGNDKGWETAEKSLVNALKEVGYKNYVYDIGGAVFYGPKIDLKVADSIGRKWQLSTIQMDFNLPGRFKMSYLDKNGKEQEPYMIHRALLGSLERFMGVYIEHTAGAFPLWLAPIQVAILPVSEKHFDYAQKVNKEFNEVQIRSVLDIDNKTLSAKIREWTLQKVPYLCIIGDKEIQKSKENLYVSVRSREGKDLGIFNIIEFKKKLKQQIEKKT